MHIKLIAEYRAMVLLVVNIIVFWLLLSYGVLPGFFSIPSEVTLLVMFYAQRYVSASSPCATRANLQNKFIVVTGPNSGVGEATVNELGAMGGESTIVFAGKDEKDTRRVMAEVKTKNPKCHCIFVYLELTEEHTIRAAATEIIALCNKSRGTHTTGGIDILIDNAGVMDWSHGMRRVEKRGKHKNCLEGHDWHIATNHLGHMLFTELLIPEVQRVKGRIVILASIGHTWIHYNIVRDSKTQLYDLLKICENKDPNRPFHCMFPYYVSKAGNIFYTRHLAQRLKGTGIRVNCLSPGFVMTNIVRYPRLRAVYKIVCRIVFKFPKEGCQTTLHCALSPTVTTSGGFYCDCERRDDVLSKQIHNDTDAALFMAWSYEAIGMPQLAPATQ